MNIFVFLINFPILGVISFLISKHSNNNENLCINCKYIIPDSFFISNNEFAKCLLYNKTLNNDNYLVTGIKMKKQKIEYSYCSISRNNENMCGKEGKDFIKRN